MPQHHCKHPTCNALLASHGYCPLHQGDRVKAEADRQRRYDVRRDPRAVKFYRSKEWLVARAIALFEHPICRQCGRDVATQVHHIVKLLLDWARRIDASNLWCVCGRCHKRIEAGDPITPADITAGGDAPRGAGKNSFDRFSTDRMATVPGFFARFLGVIPLG
jgi:5-methylcytosine-specific restriction endonuclease McrA